MTLEVVDGAGIVGTQTGTTFKIDATELFQSVSDGKSAVAAAITDKGVETAADATFQQMADNIGQIETGSTIPLANFSYSVYTSDDIYFTNSSFEFVSATYGSSATVQVPINSLIAVTLGDFSRVESSSGLEQIISFSGIGQKCRVYRVTGDATITISSDM